MLATLFFTGAFFTPTRLAAVRTTLFFTGAFFATTRLAETLLARAFVRTAERARVFFTASARLAITERAGP